MISHRKKQLKVIENIENQISNNSLRFTIVKPVTNYEIDTRLALTGVHLLHEDLIEKIRQNILSPLQDIEPSYYYYDENSLHMTIKNVRVISDPPNFDNQTIQKASDVFSSTIPQHHSFKVYFYKLLMFPNSLALIGTTDPELDEIHLDLDQKLRNSGIPDDKTYTNSKYFFSNVSLIRHPTPSDTFKEKVKEISSNLEIDLYEVDTVSLVTCNAVLKKKNIINSWKFL